MPRRSLGLLVLVVGGICCLPAVFVVIGFTSAVADLDAFQTAPKCATPTQDSRANCVSFFNGKITAQSSVGKSTRRATVAIADSALEVEVLYPGGSSLGQGSNVITEWWRGKLVLVGPAGATPTISTQESPQVRVQSLGFFLVVVGLAVALLLAGLLILQAPMNNNELIKASLAKWPDPPRPVDGAVAWRVGLGSNFMIAAPFVWLTLYVFPELFLGLNGQSRYAPWLLFVTFAISYGLVVPIATLGLLGIIRSGERRTIVVKNVTPGLGRYRYNTRISYELKDGRLDTILLDPPWAGRVKEGDSIAVLALPKTGGISQILSAPPALTDPPPAPAA
jgi:hypothetical protein